MVTVCRLSRLSIHYILSGCVTLRCPSRLIHEVTGPSVSAEQPVRGASPNPLEDWRFLPDWYSSVKATLPVSKLLAVPRRVIVT